MRLISDHRRLRRCLSLNYWPGRHFRGHHSRQVPMLATRRTALTMIRHASSGQSLSARLTHFTRASRPSVPVGTPATTSTASIDTVLPASRCTASARPTPTNRPPTRSVTRKVGSCCCPSRSRALTLNRSCFHRTLYNRTMKSRRRSAHWWRGQDSRVEVSRRRV